ncbi:M43 family zinc metalloprotease [Micromonospora sp. KC207]|uniref:M43 family zinc metalloprotease n=1 Tax=Micromonospora sp. KC207 TaxID=2530377 RepID=UPI0027399416|nr:M43 family zinc metalloprotease [Micromonospora sp. KC207]
MRPGTAGTTGMAGMAGMAGGGGDAAPTGNGAPGPPRHWCATMPVHRRLLNQNQDYARARGAIENSTRLAMSGRAGTRFPDVVRIPVVVHVVYQDDRQNISDDQIHSQLAVLNADYRAANSDVGAVPAPFCDLVGDAQIEFHLATAGPDGKPTTGITRTPTSVAQFSPDDDGIKSAATGGVDPWPAARYLNLWVGQLRDGLLGYAQFPGGPPQTDGVVITYTAFGTHGTAAAPFNLGRTATHEVGHYLNLFHIWGDDGTGCGGTDEVGDTPNQAGPNHGKPSFPSLSCDNAPNGDLFVNYMDYVDDAAMFMFTKGQVARMQACLQTARSSLLATAATPQPAAPVVSRGAGRIDVVRRGTDSALHRRWSDGTGWQPSGAQWEHLGGVCLGEPQVATWGPDRLDVFVRGTNRALLHKWWDGAGWQPSPAGYESLGGVCLGDPRVATWGPDRLDVLVRGFDRAVYHKWWDGTAWRPSTTGYDHLGGICASEPQVVSRAPSRLDVFVVGADSALHHKWWDGGQWCPTGPDWDHLGGICVGQPAAVAASMNRLDVFVVGADSALYHKWWDGTAWRPSATGYDYLGGICTSSPQVVARGPSRLDVFVTGPDAALYHKWWDGTAWWPTTTGYQRLGGVCTGDPEVVACGPDRLDVFVTGPDAALHHKWWDGVRWLPSPLEYESLGVPLGPGSAAQPSPTQPVPALVTTAT